MNSIEKVLKLCEEREITKHKLEVDCGFSNAYLSQRKDGTIPEKKLMIIADYFKVPVSALLSDSVLSPSEKANEHFELISLYERLAPSDKEMIVDMMKRLAK